MTYLTEQAQEEKLLNKLVNLGYQKAFHVKDEKSLIDNFKKQFELINLEKLNNEPLSNTEWDRVFNEILKTNVFDSSVMLREEFVIERDCGEKIYLKLLDTNKWCKNIFQVTNQIKMSNKYHSRYDVTLLINGLPLVQIELKRSGVDLYEAFRQVVNYKRDYKDLFRYIQIFVISNIQETRYFSNNDSEILKSHLFYWTDELNKRKNNLDDFSSDFLKPSHICKMISRYMVLNQTDKNLIVMRPYQVHAVEAIMKRALETKNNGYIWHTTGSGKTLTSFKASQLLAREETIKKVIFLVDRRDLDSQTLNEFNKFHNGIVDRTSSTHELIKQLKNPFQKIIITTIQKMNNAIKSDEKIMEQYKTDKVIFIIDECHRSQFGEMHREIKRHFENAQYFGFTGTPIFDENKTQNDQRTEDLFGKCIHKYLIKDAINDGNVLGFSVEYISTIANTNNEHITDDVYNNYERMKLIAKYIIDNHDKKTYNRRYTAIFAVSSINAANAYYDIFKELDHDLNITTIYSFSNTDDYINNDEKDTAREKLERVIIDYNQMFNTNFNTNLFDNYFADVSNKVKKGVEGQKIDILIVVNMFLTGFDSRVLNTLYIDKNLKDHNLIQAYSRTNRIEKETKPYGNIVAFRDLKDATDAAISLFSDGTATNIVLMASYEEYKKQFIEALEYMFELVPTPDSIDDLMGEEQHFDFINRFNAIAKILNRLRTFIEFEFTKNEIGIDQQTFEEYRGKYLNLYDRYKDLPEEDKVENNVKFELELIQTDVINVQYIMDLIRKVDLSDKNVMISNIEAIKKIIENSDDYKVRLKREIYMEFLEKVIPNLEEENLNILDQLLKFESEKRYIEIKNMSEEVKIPINILKEEIENYEFGGNIDSKNLDRNYSGKDGLMVREPRIVKAVEFIKENSEKYSI